MAKRAHRKNISLSSGGKGGVCEEASQTAGGAGEAGGSPGVHVHQQTPHQAKLKFRNT